MFISTLSILDGFKLTLPGGDEVEINLVRTAGRNVATISIDCPDNVLIEKTESTISQLEKRKRELIDDIDKLMIQHAPLLRDKLTNIKKKKGRSRGISKITSRPKSTQLKSTQLKSTQLKSTQLKSTQPKSNESKLFPSGNI